MVRLRTSNKSDPEDLPVKNGRFQLSDLVMLVTWWRLSMAPTTKANDGGFQQKVGIRVSQPAQVRPQKTGAIRGRIYHKTKPIPKTSCFLLQLLCLPRKRNFKAKNFWLVVSTPLRNMKVGWDDYSYILWKIKNKKTNHQPDLNGCSVMEKGWR